MPLSLHKASRALRIQRILRRKLPADTISGARHNELIRFLTSSAISTNLWSRHQLRGRGHNQLYCTGNIIPAKRIIEFPHGVSTLRRAQADPAQLANYPSDFLRPEGTTSPEPPRNRRDLRLPKRPRWTGISRRERPCSTRFFEAAIIGGLPVTPLRPWRPFGQMLAGIHRRHFVDNCLDQNRLDHFPARALVCRALVLLVEMQAAHSKLKVFRVPAH
jgi:hypothetical protein